MFSILWSIIAGAAMSVQGVINTRLSEKIGLYESNTFVQGTAFLFSLIALLFLGRGSYSNFLDVKKIYWIGGLLGIIITITVMLSIKELSPTIAISIILISQLLVAACVDFFGLFDSQRLAFEWTKFLGLFFMIAGVVLFKLNLEK